MSIWKSTKQSESHSLLSRISQESKYPDDVWSVIKDPSSLCYVLCVTRKKENGERIKHYQKISQEEFLDKPGTVDCIARSMVERLTRDCRRAEQQDRKMPHLPGDRTMTQAGWGRPDLIDPLPPTLTNIKFFRCNKEVTEQYSHEFPEPLDELRMSVAIWLNS